MYRQWKREGRRGGTDTAARRASQILSDGEMAADVVIVMSAWFARHEVDKQAEGFRPGEKGYPSPGRVAWAAWGGDAGKTWADAKANAIKRARGEKVKAYKRPNPKRILDKMPDGEPLYRVARDYLKAAGRQYLRQYAADIFPLVKEFDPLDPLSASLGMAEGMLPTINSYIDLGGRVAIAELDLQAADDWLVRAPEVIDAARSATLDLCQETIDTFNRDLGRTLDGIRNDIANSIQSGETAGDTVNRVSKWLNDNARWRARRIAVTESARAFNTGQIASTENYDFVAGYKLVLSADACPLCHAIERQCPMIRKGGSFGENGKNETYKDLKAPPFHPGCVLGETPIRAASIVAATHAKYQGPIARINCSDGSSFSVTANHMLLTPLGFFRAADLVKGDYILRTSTTPEGFSSPSLGGPNNHNCPATASEIFRSLSESVRVRSSSVPASPKYLHGDARFVDGQIDIVRPNRLLWRDTNSFLGQPLNHIDLIGRSNHGISFNSLRDLASVLNTLRLATDGGMGRRRELESVLRACLRHSGEHCLGSISRSNSNILQASYNQWSADTKKLGKTLDGLPGKVTTTKIIDIDIFTPQEPVSVYDFETDESMYIIDNGIISSNCRCTIIVVFDDEVPNEWKKPVKPGPGGYIIPSETDFANAIEGGYESVAIGNAKSLSLFLLTE